MNVTTALVRHSPADRPGAAARRTAPLSTCLPATPNPHRAAPTTNPATRQLARTTVRLNRTIALTYSLEQPV